VKAADTTKTAYEMKKAALTTASAPPPPPEPKSYDVNMKLTGVADTDVQVAQFLSRLGKSKLFRDVNLMISDEYEHEGHRPQDAEISDRADAGPGRGRKPDGDKPGERDGDDGGGGEVKSGGQ
jgi:hypothetical protein